MKCIVDVRGLTNVERDSDISDTKTYRYRQSCPYASHERMLGEYR